MKGNLAIDLILMMVVLFGLAVVFVYINELNKSVMDPLIAQNLTGTQGTQILQAQRDGFAPLWDNLGILLFGGLWVFLLISAYYVKTSPVFFMVMAVLMIAAFIVIMILANAFDVLNQETTFRSSSADFLSLTWLMYHLLEAGIVVVITTGIALYAKNDDGVGL